MRASSLADDDFVFFFAWETEVLTDSKSSSSSEIGINSRRLAGFLGFRLFAGSGVFSSVSAFAGTCHNKCSQCKPNKGKVEQNLQVMVNKICGSRSRWDVIQLATRRAQCLHAHPRYCKRKAKKVSETGVGLRKQYLFMKFH